MKEATKKKTPLHHKKSEDQYLIFAFLVVSGRVNFVLNQATPSRFILLTH